MINSQKCLFVGAFEKRGDLNNRATSSAGNQVQCEIIEALKNLGLDDTFYINNPKTESTQDFEIVTVILPKYKAFQAKKWELEFLNSRLSNPSKK